MPATQMGVLPVHPESVQAPFVHWLTVVVFVQAGAAPL